MRSAASSRTPPTPVLYTGPTVPATNAAFAAIKPAA